MAIIRHFTGAVLEYVLEHVEGINNGVARLLHM